ncbi:phage tail assembly protein [Methylobacterium radiotolerans]|uniref:phage tail assembly protein n=1 Tax=Methylobacterium radiotolerans TaxID=31998 RepID=UPI001F39CBDF|nr:phage tail assembly protein [Methylobacterium radiotolerans]UIY45861.1 phage tail assembly protein [Methylobacterium radiotolerans]
MSNETASAPVKHPEITAWPYEFPLSKPITVGQDTVQFLRLNEPTAKEAFEYGLLTGLAADQVRGLVAALAVTPPPVIDKIPAADIIQLAARLSRFFNAAAA